MSFLEAGIGLTLLSRKLGVRRRAVPLHILRMLMNAKQQGRHEVEIAEDVFIVHRAPSTKAPKADGPKVTGGAVYASLAKRTKQIDDN